jgi:polyisoprenoid-binding protein YceI
MSQQHRLSSAQCWVFTYKEGLFATLAHDLKLKVGKFNLLIDYEPTNATFQFIFQADTSTIEVCCAQTQGQDQPQLLKTSDKVKIERTIREEVLACEKYPKVSFRSQTLCSIATNTTFPIEGSLVICGRQRPLKTSAQLEKGQWCVDLKLHQPDFGIQPYRAMMGALRIRSDIRIMLKASHQELKTFIGNNSSL